MRRGSALAVLVTLTPLVAHAEGDDVPERKVRLSAAGDRVLLSCDLADLVDRATRRRLTSGFTVRFVLRAYLFDADADTALDATARTLEVRYDLWDEDFRIVERDGAGHRTSRLAGVEAVRRLAGSVEDLPAFDRRLLSPGRRYYVAVVGQVDPLSDEQLSEVRRWLSRPQDGHRDLALGGRSFLGSFVSLFVNVKVGQAARELRFRSQTFATGDLQAARAAGATP